MQPLNLLLLCDQQPRIAATVHDHINALVRYSRHRIYRLPTLGTIPAWLDLSRFDGLIVHYTLVACSEYYLSSKSRARLGTFAGLKAMFIQDEYRFVDSSIGAMREIGINLLFTCVPPSEIEKVYSSDRLPGVTKVNVLTGYVPEELVHRKVLPPSHRPIDIGYRGRTLPAWLGKLGQEKLTIGMRIAQDAPHFGLKTDISFREEDRLYGEAWVAFVSRCKAMLGVESGASVFDFSGKIQRDVERHVKLNPNVTFDELRDLYFAQEEGKIRLAQISPRCFESAALRTLMILYEGEYSGILKPWRHYVPLKKDHSNMAEIVAVLRDSARVEEITECAHREIALNPAYSFTKSVSDVDAAIEAAIREPMLSRKPAYSPRAFSLLTAFAFDFTKRRRRALRWLQMRGYKFLYTRVLGFASPQRRDIIHRRIRKIYHPLTSRLFGTDQG